jgi:hypothetical protein
VFQKCSLSLKKYENFDANKFLEPTLNQLFMKNFQSLFLSFILCLSFTVHSQIEVRTLNPDETPNSNCYFSVDSVQIGLANRNGFVFIDENLKGKEVIITELDTGWKNQFILKSDTTIVLEEVQILSEVEIKPRNTKTLYKEIMELNQNRLPEKLNLKGEVFFAELYIIENERSGGETDTILDVFSCEIIILDVFGDKTILAKNAIKYREGNISNEAYFKKVEGITIPSKNFDRQLIGNLNYKTFEMKKFRKYNSSVNIGGRNKYLKFYKIDSSTIAGLQVKEFLYSWKKQDSSLVQVSSYYRQGDKSSNLLSFPFGYRDFSNPNCNYSDSHILSESGMRIFNESQQINVINNVFKYFNIEGRVDDDASNKGFKQINSFEELYNETKSKKPDEDIIPVLYPLRFPISIFF